MKRGLTFLFLLSLCGAVGCKNDGGTATTDDDRSGTPGGGNQNNNSTLTSRQYFDQFVSPAFTAGSCNNCHKFIFQGGTAPMTIWDYSAMAPKLRNGGTAEGNELMIYAQGQNGHAFSQNFCGGNTNNSPCYEIKIWWTKEVGSSGGGGNIGPIGNVTNINLAGKIDGWARDPDEPGRPVSVEVYVGGPRGSGTFLAAVTADRPYNGAEISGNVGFSYTLPDQYRDGQARSLYVYAMDTEVADAFSQLRNSPQTKRAYAPSQAGRDLYNSTVLAYINQVTNPPNGTRCNNCHSPVSFEYDNAFYSLLLTPAPPAGSATNNTLYNRLVGHDGGSFCGGNPAATPPCSDLIDVWNLEFN